LIVARHGPVWAGRAANPVRTYLRQFGDTFKQVAYFITLGGASAEKALTNMEMISGKRPIATLAVTQKDIANGNYDLAARNFARSLQQAAGQHAAEVA
jgi:hypothetical protein